MILDEKKNMKLIDVVIPELYETSQPRARYKKGITAPRPGGGENKVLSMHLFKSFFFPRRKAKQFIVWKEDFPAPLFSLWTVLFLQKRMLDSHIEGLRARGIT